jgi:hypothetical protein
MFVDIYPDLDAVIPAHPAQGPTYRVRHATFDYPLRISGRDRHAPPTLPSEGPACQVRFSEGRARRVRELPFDNPFRFGRHDKRAPPTCLSPYLQVRRALHNSLGLRHAPGNRFAGPNVIMIL